MKILKNRIHLSLILLHTIILSSLQSTSSLDFVFNGFSNSSEISLYGDAAIESRVVSLTNKSSNSIGRALYKSKIQTKNPSTKSVLPFSVSFIFSIAPYEGILPGHGFVFLFVPFTGVQGSVASQHLGFLNFTNNGNSSNHILGIEFDVFKNQEFDDIDDNHVGVNLNSLKSSSSNTAGYWIDELRKEFKELKLNNGENYQVWIDYADSLINVTMSPVGEIRPSFPLLNVSLNLSDVFEEQMYVGFTSSTGTLIEGHRILAWSFSNTNFSLSESLITTGLPSFVLPKTPFTSSTWFISVMVVMSFLVIVFFIVSSMVFIKRKQKRAKERAEMEEWELEYWPHRMTYLEIERSTKSFADENVIGVGGNGKVYKGVLQGGIEIAVKRIPQENNEGMRAFLAEIASLGRLKHRNLVGLRGWCKKDKGNFMLVYDYMENGSLDKRVFECRDDKLLTCDARIRVLKDVAEGVLYLHEGWESKVLHRDIKASNVLLDKDMKGKLGDFGLARIHLHNQVATTTRVVGTVGYLAPEVIKTGRASSQTDVFGFGVLILEVMCGRRPVEEGKPLLVEWVWEQMAQDKLVSALDSRLGVNVEGESLRFDEVEVERVLHLGLLCAYPDPSARPTMRQVVNVLEGKNEGHDTTTTTTLDQGENMETYLLQKVKSREMWSNYALSFVYGSSHPTFDDIKQSNSSSMSVSWNNSIMEDGR